MLGRVAALAIRPAGRIVELGSQAALAGLEAAGSSRFAAEAVDRILATPVAERAVTRALAGPVSAAVNGQAAERLAAQVIDGRIFDVAVRRLLESEDLWLLVEEIAGSPAVTDAIGRQGLGLADPGAGGGRGRPRAARAPGGRVARRPPRRGPRGGG